MHIHLWSTTEVWSPCQLDSDSCIQASFVKYAILSTAITPSTIIIHSLKKNANTLNDQTQLEFLDEVSVIMWIVAEKCQIYALRSLKKFSLKLKSQILHHSNALLKYFFIFLKGLLDTIFCTNNYLTATLLP